MTSIILHPSPVLFPSPSYDVAPFQTHDPLAWSNTNAGRRKVGHSESPSTFVECRVSLGSKGGRSLGSSAKSTEETEHGSKSTS